MAFKMKGSPIKLGKIQGTAGHASALKQVEISPLKHKEDAKHWHGPGYLPETYKGQNVLAEFKKWKEENNPSESEKREWRNNWKESVNDPTMPSQEQARNIVLPKWAQEKWNLPEGSVLGSSQVWNTIVPGSGSSNNTRVISMDSGEGAAVEGTSTFDDRTQAQIESDAAKLENIKSGNVESLEEQGIITPERKKELEEIQKQDELLKKQHEELQSQEIVPLETENVSTELLTSDVAPPELVKMKGQKHFEKHGYYPLQDPERHRKHLMDKFGRKEGKAKFKIFAKNNKINI